MGFFPFASLVDVIGENALSGVVGLAVGAILAGFGRLLLLQRPSRRLFGLPSLEQTSVVIGAPLEVTPGEPKLGPIGSGLPVFGIGPLMAYSRVTHLLRDAYRKQGMLTPVSSRGFPASSLGDAMILFGYPAGNEVTAQVLSGLALPIYFRGHDLLDSETDEVLYQATVEDGKVIHDFGLLLRAPNPFAPTNPVILFAGCETYGVKAAADFLAIRNYHVLRDVPLLRFGRAAAMLDWLIPSYVKSSFYVLVVSTNVTGTYTTPPYLVRYWRLTPDIVL